MSLAESSAYRRRKAFMSQAFAEHLWSSPDPLGAFAIDGFDEETTLYRPAM